MRLTPEQQAVLDRFSADKLELLSQPFDEARMVTFGEKYGQTVEGTTEVRRAAFHKARTSVTAVPMSLRTKSKRWLKRRGLAPLDDGDVPE